MGLDLTHNDQSNNILIRRSFYFERVWKKRYVSEYYKKNRILAI